MKLAREVALVALGSGDPPDESGIDDWLLAHRRTADGASSVWRRPMRALAAGAFVAKRRGEVAAALSAVAVDRPFARVTAGLADRLAEVVGGSGYVALSTTSPRAVETVALMRAEGIRRAVVFAVDPFHRPLAQELDLALFRAAWNAAGGDERDLLVLGDLGLDPGIHAALVSVWRETTAFFRAHVPPALFLAPGDEPGPARRAELEARVRETAMVLGLDPDRSALAFLAGLAGEERPADQAAAALAAAPRDGSNRLCVLPFGYLSDRLDTLHIVDRELVRLLREEKMTVFRVPCPNDRGEIVLALSRIVRAAAFDRGFYEFTERR